jgi:hypothetical protein
VKELRGSAVNLSYVESAEGNLKALAEVVLIRSEPIYRIDDGGSVIRQRALDDVRFSTTSVGLRDTAARFIEWASEMEQHEEALADVRLPEPQTAEGP